MKTVLAPAGGSRSRRSPAGYRSWRGVRCLGDIAAVVEVARDAEPFVPIVERFPRFWPQ